jgi:hypothetical protein
MEISVFRTDFESGPTETGGLIAYSRNSAIIVITVTYNSDDGVSLQVITVPNKFK